VDSRTPDTGPPDTAVPPPSCDDLFGTQEGYTLCMENASECEFYVVLNGETCRRACERGGQSCRGAHQEGMPDVCMYEPELESCGRRVMDAVCVCELR